MLITGLIPVRYASTRFPGKPLAILGEKPIIRHVYENASRALDQIFVVTDDLRIANEAGNFGAKVLMTSHEHKSGTDRCAEAIEILEHDYSISPDAIINIQGDEPFIKPEQINLLCSAFNDNRVQIATLAKKFGETDEINDPNKVKVVFDKRGDALYFSRLPIPYVRNTGGESAGKVQSHYKHLGIYGYLTGTLKQISKLKQSDLEIAESLEQIRWLDNGLNIRVLITEFDSIGIDTPDDLAMAAKMLK